MTAAESGAKQSDRETHRDRPQPEGAIADGSFAAGIDAGVNTAMTNMAPAVSASVAAAVTAAQTKPPPNKETWRDWLPPGFPEPPPEELVDLDQLLGLVTKLGSGVKTTTTAREIRYLQTLGIVPRPTFQHRNGVNVGVYPRWVRSVVWNALIMRRDRVSWDDIRSMIRDRLHQIMEFDAMQEWPEFPPQTIVRALNRALDDLAAWEYRQNGRSAARAEVTFLDKDDQWISTRRHDIPQPTSTE